MSNNDSSCPHIAQNRQVIMVLDDVLYKIIFPDNAAARDAQAKYVRCYSCEKQLVATMCACLSCSTFACLKHMRSHLKANAHQFAVSMEIGVIFCAVCNDFVYDRKLERSRREAENAQRRSLNISTRSIWYPDAAFIDVCRHDPSRIIQLTRYSTRGLRGLVNLGNTCFMNCIIQAMVHTPHLKDYFLTDQHHCTRPPDSQCLMCELSTTFQAFYNGEVAPYKPHRFLNLVWTHARHLAGYEQQDAHEFLIASLDVLHQHSGNSDQTMPNECNCIIDWIFTGKLQSDLTCTVCGCVSTTVDPIWDISLDITEEVLKSPPSSNSQITLEDCLQRYIRPEHLGSSAKTKCERCKTYEESTKQLTLKTLPLVACFHLKRFEHSTKHRKKINTKIIYPQFIDMTPFTASFRERPRDVNVSSSSELLTTIRNKYELFAVVNHLGTMESGHYTCYIRHQHNQWFQCDDHIISKAPVEAVLSSEGYLLFYHKCHLDYY